MEQQRCHWPGDDPIMVRYHDEEWGTPVHDDRALFEFLVLEGAQAGLSWRTILRKRDAYRRAFDNFEPVKVATFDETTIQALLADAGIVRNRLKIRGAVSNAHQFLAIQREFGSFDSYIWGFTGGQTLRRGEPFTLEDIPATTPESDAMANDLNRRRFTFAGSTICYAFMQAVGIVNDHVTGCIRGGSLVG
jgi:DNA-3-methyladenine glycosylase I